MAYNDQIITDPVTDGDIKSALRTSEVSESDWCTHDNVNLMSKFKPTDYLTINFNPKIDTGLADSQWKGELIKQNGYTIRASVGIQIPYGLIPESQFDGVSDYKFFNTGLYRNVPATIINNKWSKITPTKFRQLDFWKYTSRTPDYPLARNKFPISFSNMTVQTLKYNTLDQTGTLLAVAELHFDYKDISVKNIAYWLGVRSLLDAQTGVSSQHNLKFGFMIISNPQAQSMHFAITDAVEMTLDDSYDQTTGLVGYRNIALDGVPLIKPSFDDGFQVNEEVYIVPYIRRSLMVGDTSYRCYFGLNADDDHLAYQKFKIRNSGLSVQTVKLQNAVITVTYQVVETKTSSKVIMFSITNVSHMSFTFTAQAPTSDLNNRFYFLTNDFAIIRNDSNGYMVEQHFATLGLSYDDDIGARYVHVTANPQSKNATGLLYGVSDAASLSRYFTKYEYSSSLTSAKIGAQIVFMEFDSGTGEMIQRSVSFQSTINPSTAGSTPQTIQMPGTIV